MDRCSVLVLSEHGQVFSETSLVYTPQISSPLTFHSSFYWNKSLIILLYTILLLPQFICDFIQNGCVRISEV